MNDRQRGLLETLSGDNWLNLIIAYRNARYKGYSARGRKGCYETFRRDIEVLETSGDVILREYKGAIQVLRNDGIIVEFGEE